MNTALTIGWTLLGVVLTFRDDYIQALLCFILATLWVLIGALERGVRP